LGEIAELWVTSGLIVRRKKKTAKKGTAKTKACRATQKGLFG